MSYGPIKFDKETELQEQVRHFLETQKFGPIIEERGLGAYPDLQKHQYLLIDEFIKAVRRLNANLWTCGIYVESEESIVDAIRQDFIAQFDRARGGADVHDLLFGLNRRTITLTRLTGETDGMVGYRVIDTDYSRDCRNNVVTAIKEKAIRMTRGSRRDEKPDFAFYLNGIPVLVTEVKNPLLTNGIYEALKDYKEKKTYHKFLACLLTDGVNAAICANPTAVSVDKWQAYGLHRRPDREETNGLYDLFEELVFNVRNLVLYLQYGLFKIHKGGDSSVQYLGNLRVQQYYVMKAALRRIENCDGDETFRDVVKQPPRSGKTIAIRSIIAAVTSQHPDKFEKIFIQVPDLTIMDQFYRDFAAFSFGGGFQVKKVDSRKPGDISSTGISYEEAVRETGRTIYIMNMQKFSDDMRSLRNPGCRALIFIDEVHTHQRGLNAAVRDINFPNASYITFTATPRKKAQESLPTDLTLMDYSTSERFLDELLNADAKALGMVAPVVFEKARYKVAFDENNARRLSEHVDDEIRNRILNDPDFHALHEEVVVKTEGYKDKLRLEDETSEEIIEARGREYYESQINEKADNVIGRLKTEISYRLRMENIPSVVEDVVSDLQAKIVENYSDSDLDTGERTPRFKAKAFLVVEDQRMANEVARHVAELSGGTNVIGGFKFGLDYSDGMRFGERRSFMEEFNRISYGSTIKADFDSQEPDSTAILIIVGKYLMGYDNKQLVAVYCYTSIKEPGRIYQLYTRPGTQFAGKDVGFFVDMGFGEVNHNAFCKAMDWFEGGEKSTLLLPEDGHLVRQKGVLKELVERLSKLLGIEPQALSEHRHPARLFVNLPEKMQHQALAICKEIKTAVRNLLSPKYYGEFIGYLLAINKALFGLMHQMKANTVQLVFTKNDIAQMLSEFLQVLRLDIDDIMKVELVGDRIVKIREDSKSGYSVISTKVFEAKRLIDVTRPFLGSDIFTRLQRMAEDIDSANHSDDAAAKAAADLTTKAREAFKSIVWTIQNKFEGHADWFVTFHVMRNTLRAKGIDINEQNSVFREFTRRYSTEVRNYVTGSKRDGVLEYRDSVLANARKAMTKLIGEFLEQDTETFQSIYKQIGDRQNSETLAWNLIKEVHGKAHDFQQHLESGVRT